MEKTNELSQLQKIAIEGELARTYSTSNHDPEVLYRFYIMLTKAPKKLKGLITQYTYELTEVDREKLYRVSLESMMDITPVWIWIDRTIEDLKLSLTLGSIETEKVSLNKRTLRKKMIRSAFVFFCRNAAVVSPSATLELCRTIMEREPLTLDFLSDVCFMLIEQISELKMDKKVRADLLDLSFDIRTVLSYQIETEVIKEIIKESDKEQSKVKSTLESAKATPLSEQKEYIVAKKYLNEDTTVVIKSFSTKEEATEFINTIKGQFPEVQRNFEFFIIGAKSGKSE